MTKEEGRRKKEEGRRKREEGRGKKEELIVDHLKFTIVQLPIENLKSLGCESQISNRSIVNRKSKIQNPKSIDRDAPKIICKLSAGMLHLEISRSPI